MCPLDLTKKKKKERFSTFSWTWAKNITKI